MNILIVILDVIMSYDMDRSEGNCVVLDSDTVICLTTEESDATKKGQKNSTEENRIGQEGEGRKSYSAAVIDGIKRKSKILWETP